MNKLFSSLVCILLILMSVGFFTLYKKNQELTQKVVTLELSLSEIMDRNNTLEKRIAEMEGKSITGIIDRVNQSVIESWGNMIEAIDEELEKIKVESDSTAPKSKNDDMGKDSTET